MTNRLRALAGHLLLGLYPEAWRERYRPEVEALIDDDPPGGRGLGSLLAGAADAHVHPQPAWRDASSPLARMRLSIGGVFCCWIAISLIGAGFQQETEDFTLAAHRHPLLALAHDAILAAALLGAVAVAAGGLPLLWRACGQAWVRRDRRLALLLALPALAMLCLAGLTWLLIVVAPARHGGFPAAFVLALGVPWTLGAIACALVCALTPRAVLRRIGATRRSLRRASWAGAPLALAMCVITLALIAYELSLQLQAPALASEATGPLGASVGATLAGQCAIAAISTALGLLGAARAHRAASQPT